MSKARGVAVFMLALCAGFASNAGAQEAAERWTYTLQPYVWLPGMKAKLNYGPPAAGGSSAQVDLDAQKLLNAADMAAMLAGEARRGRWLIGLDAMYLDFGAMDSRVSSVDFNPGGGPVNVSTAHLNTGTLTDMSSTVLTLVGGYAMFRDRRNSLDLIGGVRYFRMHAKTSWQLSAVVTGPAGSAAFARAGVVEKSDDLWTGIVGVKGRAGLGNGKWFLNYYGDIGSGSSATTWQAIAGLGHAFKWGDLVLDYRALNYNAGGQSLMDEVTARGLSLGARFHF